MKIFSNFAKLAKLILLTEKRVEDNSKAIYELRQEVKALTKFSYEVANAVQRSQDRAEHRHEILVSDLQAELMKLEKQFIVTNLSGRNTLKAAPFSPPE